MKILPQLTTATARKIVATKMPKQNQQRMIEIKAAIAKNISSQVRANLERHAEEMKPETYIEMRNYISRLEMEELIKNGLL